MATAADFTTTFRCCGIRSTPLTGASSEINPRTGLSPILPLILKLSIILVPGTGTTSPENWPFADQNWLSTLPRSGSGARVLAYEYASSLLDTEFSWEWFLILGYDFLQCLTDARSKLDAHLTDSKPMVIVCHSLGGIVAKQALCVANKQFHRYGPTVNAITGIIFLSTPHRYGDKIMSLSHFRDILEATTGRSSKVTTATVEREGAILIDLADRFEGISLRTPILSSYELRESRISSTPLRPKYQLLVDREACSTHAPMETVVGLNLDHYDTCIFTKSVGGEGLRELNEFVHRILVDAVQLVALRLKEQDYQYATMSAYSPTMSETSFQAEQLELSEQPSYTATEWPSNGATEGTTSSGFELIYPATPNIEPKKSVHLPCVLLNTHSSNKNFCGREDVLERLAAELLPSKNIVTASGTALQQFALCGLGGIGKTEIAREFSRRHRAAFDAVFWVTADEIAKLDHHYQQISLALGLEDSSACKSQVVSREIVKGWLSNPQKHLSGYDELGQPGQARSEATWLLVFDNADDPMILADYWPQGSGSILIISRDPLAKRMFTGRTSGLDLGPLTQQDSLSLFSQLTSVSSEHEDDIAQNISKALGGFFELYTDHEEHANLYGAKFDTNLLLELISFLDPDFIGEDVLIEASVMLLSDGVQFKKSAYIEARADLLQSSLVQRDKQRQQLSVHRIVQDVIVATMDEAKKRSMFDLIVRTLWAGWPSAMPKPSKEPELPQPKSSGGRLHVGRWPVCAAIYPHVLKIHQLWSAISDLSGATKLHFAKLLNEAAWYQKERGRTKDFDGFFETARSICESSTHADRDSLLADIYFCLGAIAMDASDLDKSRVYEELSLALVSKICSQLGTADERLYLAYAERGISRIQDKRYEEGEADLKEALRIRKALGNYVPRSGEVNLSWALLAQGKLEECSEVWVKMTGNPSGQDWFCMHLAIFVLREIGGTTVWTIISEQCAICARRWVSGISIYTANVAHKIAEHLIRLGRSEESITMANGALEAWSVDPSAHKNEIARTTFLTGRLFETTGTSQKASIAFRVACRLRKEITHEDRDVKSLTMLDFDDIVAFWAR
ncbi:tetratricopeptide repeat domain-containing protein [Pleomassaria siparia CBS 279.74]|uniref:Tetratricopeptide repeat domain-containing protein n=1 Tax=Pleomassaria siparia CBS 279.74 TaxID=1314801 RepID=A0A6G1K9Q4_9PLEO|nr:tetratricopeptide repeat domain-containing protein [Pleomassaria siparia CBS 279.74]